MVDLYRHRRATVSTLLRPCSQPSPRLGCLAGPTMGRWPLVALLAVSLQATGQVQYGIASFYSNKFEGRKTYTDEIFTQDSLTGASNTLPMHVWVKVTNLWNKRTVFVRINDKMHPGNKRIIDLSHAAAVKLGYAGRGLTRVRIDVMGKKKPPEAEDETADRRQGQD
jgi:rare lipoprotein A